MNCTCMVTRQVRSQASLILVSLFWCLPGSAFAAGNLAELDLGNMAEPESIKARV